MKHRDNEAWAVERSRQLAASVLDGDYDPLLACRELASLRSNLPNVPDEIMNTFVGVASEIDDLAIGPERELWAAAALELHDARAANYRGRITRLVKDALKALLDFFDRA